MDLGKIASWQKAKPSAAHFSRFSYVENMCVIVIGDRLNFYINIYIIGYITFYLNKMKDYAESKWEGNSNWKSGNLFPQ